MILLPKPNMNSFNASSVLKTTNQHMLSRKVSVTNNAVIQMLGLPTCHQLIVIWSIKSVSGVAIFFTTQVNKSPDRVRIRQRINIKITLHFKWTFMLSNIVFSATTLRMSTHFSSPQKLYFQSLKIKSMKITYDLSERKSILSYFP